MEWNGGGVEGQVDAMSPNFQVFQHMFYFHIWHGVLFPDNVQNFPEVGQVA